MAVARGTGAGCLNGTRIPFSRALSDWVQRSRERLSRSDPLSEGHSVSVRALAGHSLCAGLSIPMLAGGKFVGILHFSSEHARHTEARQVRSKALNILASCAWPRRSNAHR